MSSHLCSAIVLGIVGVGVDSAVARGVPLPSYDAAGFTIPDNNALGASSSVHTPFIDVVHAMQVVVQFPSTTSEGGHTWCGDLRATLTFTPDASGPALSVDLFNRIGANSAGSRGDSSDFTSQYRFFATGGADIWTMAALAGPTQRVPGFQYRPSSRTPDFQYQDTSYFEAFGNATPAGTWTLSISDHAAGDSGRILGWQIFPFIPAPGTGALIAAGSLGALRRRR